ncbi:hypothetical protein AB0H37_00390 [Actinomadura sp. NPDC023710]|uniref:hypothetical protein n=1 Tax=Actinomadura sp. NPDC023710 TaxID=3158219 RepID=UPI00340C5D81
MNNVESYIRDHHDDAHELLCAQRRRCSPASTKGKTSQPRPQPPPSSALADHLIPRDADLFGQGFALASIVAARTFHRDTAHQNALTTLTERPS